MPASQDQSRRFGLLWVSAAVSSVGDGAYMVAGPLLAAYLTSDPIAVSIVSVAASAPWFLVGFWSGAVVDRVSRRWIMIVADVARMLGLLGLAVLVLTDTASIAALAAASFLMTSGRCFFDPASQALVPHVVSRNGDALARANGRLVATETVGASFVGPPLGGALFALGPWVPLALDAISFGASAAVLLGVPRDEPPPNPAGQTVTTAVREGFAYLVRSRRLVLLAIAVGLFNVGYMLGAATLVLYVNQTLHVTSFGFGLLMASMALGAVGLGSRAAPIVRKLGTAGALLAGGIVQAAGWLGLAVTSNPWLASVPLLLLGAGTTLVTVSVVTARQEIAPDHLLGRVVSAFRLIGNGLALLGAAGGGLIAASLNLTAPLIAAALVTSVAVISLALPLLRSLRN